MLKRSNKLEIYFWENAFAQSVSMPIYLPSFLCICFCSYVCFFVCKSIKETNFNVFPGEGWRVMGGDGGDFDKVSKHKGMDFDFTDSLQGAGIGCYFE